MVSDQRLLTEFNIGFGMAPYSSWLRLWRRINDPDNPQAKQCLEDSSAEMAKILKRKKVPKDKAGLAINETLFLAAKHQVECSRLERYFETLPQARKATERLITHIDRLAEALSKLTSSSLAKLNEIMVEHEWRNFDTEAFSELIHAMLGLMPTLSPRRVANEAHSAMSDASIQSYKAPAVRAFPRIAPPPILELWEIIPPETRTKVEGKVRRRRPPKSALEFFRHLALDLRKHSRTRRVRRPPKVRLFGDRAASVWLGLSLHVGRAFIALPAYHVESDFQKFCRLALTAVGDNSRISGRQILELKSRKRKRQPVKQR